MGSLHTAYCDCGFTKRVIVGGGMNDTPRSKSPFPYYCKSCGLVDVDTARKTPKCPSCKSPQVSQYGLPPVSLDTNSLQVVVDYERTVYAEGNLCPSCNNFTLQFYPADVLFD